MNIYTPTVNSAQAPTFSKQNSLSDWARLANCTAFYIVCCFFSVILRCCRFVWLWDFLCSFKLCLGKFLFAYRSPEIGRCSLQSSGEGGNTFCTSKSICLPRAAFALLLVALVAQTAVFLCQSRRRLGTGHRLSGS